MSRGDTERRAAAHGAAPEHGREREARMTKRFLGVAALAMTLCGGSLGVLGCGTTVRAEVPLPVVVAQQPTC
jgi:hypothetical protein